MISEPSPTSGSPPTGPERSAGQPAVTAVVGGQRFAVAADTVRCVVFAGPLTPLPFVPPWIEGVTSVNSEPVLQIDLARALAGAAEGGEPGPGDKLLVVKTSRGAIALRVDRVETGTGEASAGEVPHLRPEALVIGLSAAPRDEGEGGLSASSGQAGGPPAVVLVVTDGATRTGVLIDEGISVAEVASSLLLDTGDGAVQMMATVGDRLIAACRLSDKGGTSRAVIGPTAEGWRAVLVDRLIGLERLPVDRLVLLPGSAPGRNLCFRTADQTAIAIQDFGKLAGGSGATGPAYRHLLERVEGRLTAARAQPFLNRPSSGSSASGGLRVSVRGVSWLVPLNLVERMLGDDERLVAGRRHPGKLSVPVLDAGLWLASAAPSAAASDGSPVLLLRLPEGARIAVRVDSVALEAPASAPPWQPPPALPPELAALVDAVRLEPGSGHWCLRLAATLDPASFQPSFRRTIATACLGRLTPAGRSRSGTHLQGTPL